MVNAWVKASATTPTITGQVSTLKYLQRIV